MSGQSSRGLKIKNFIITVLFVILFVSLAAIWFLRNPAPPPVTGRNAYAAEEREKAPDGPENPPLAKKSAKKPANPLALIGRLPDDSKSIKGEKEKGNPENCVRRGGEAYPSCNWYDAKAYCGGRLPGVAKLKWYYQRDCTGGKTSQSCKYWFWASETSNSAAGYSDGIESDEAPLDESEGYYFSFESGSSGSFRRSYKSVNVRCN